MSRKTLLNIKDLSVSFVNTTVLRDFSLSVMRGEIVAVVGANGCGKSTTLDVVQAQHTNDQRFFEKNLTHVRGIIDFAPHIEISYLPQDLRRDWSDKAPATEDYSLAGIEARLKRAFGLDAMDRPAAELSDGQLQKLAIVRTLTAPADLYLLDEPTNYLDIDGLTALEDTLIELRRRDRGVVIVTHDRALTDQVADRTVFITVNGLYQCRGGFSAAWSLTTSDFAARRKQAQDIKRRIGKLQRDVRRRFAWSAAKEKSKIGAGRAKPTIARQAKKMAARAQAVRKRVDREITDLERKKPFIPKALKLAFPEYEIRNREVFHLRDLRFSYSDTGRPLLDNITLAASTSDKLCLMGANGAGKSTLFKLILGELEPHDGERYLHPAVRVKYLPQGLSGFFTHERLLDNLLECGHETTVRQYLGAALLRRDKVTEPIEKFSQGELIRAAIVKCILDRAEFLLLDEPTSHLDIESIEVLESLLGAFCGGFLMISHDRTFVENASDKLYLLEEGRLRLV